MVVKFYHIVFKDCSETEINVPNWVKAGCESEWLNAEFDSSEIAYAGLGIKEVVNNSINGVELKENGFVFDGCHKFYLVDKNDPKQVAEANEWSGNEIFDIEKLPEMFYNSCPLRFIRNWDLDSVIPQGIKIVVFKINGKETVVDFENDKINEL